MTHQRTRFQYVRIGILALFVLSQLYFIFLKHHYTLDIDTSPNSQPTPAIHSQTFIGQTFIAPRDNLARIDIMLGTHNRTNDKDIRFELWEIEPKRKQMVLDTFNAAEVQNNMYFSLKFQKVLDSQGKKYKFSLLSRESTLKNSISAWMNEDNIYRGGEYWLKDQRTKGDLIFRVYSKRPIFTELGRIVRNYRGIFGSKAFLIFVIIFFELMQILVLWTLLGYIHKTWKTA